MSLNFAHRGWSGLYPENTLLAFQKAIELGVDGFEMDVQLSRDGEVVVFHDETLDRVTGYHGYLRDLTVSGAQAARRVVGLSRAVREE